MIVILAINHEMGLVNLRYHVTCFKIFVNMIMQTVDLFPEQYHGCFVLHMLPPYNPLLNPAEQSHSCFKAGKKNELARREMQLELVDDAASRTAGQTQQLWRGNILLQNV